RTTSTGAYLQRGYARRAPNDSARSRRKRSQRLSVTNGELGRLEVSSNRAAEDAACRAFGGTTEPRLLHPCEDAKAILLLEGQASCRMLKLAHAGHTSTHNSRSIPAKDPHASVV